MHDIAFIIHIYICSEYVYNRLYLGLVLFGAQEVLFSLCYDHFTLGINMFNVYEGL